jgi:hypothetical protein
LDWFASESASGRYTAIRVLVEAIDMMLKAERRSLCWISS